MIPVKIEPWRASFEESVVDRQCDEIICWKIFYIQQWKSAQYQKMAKLIQNFAKS